MSVKHQPETPLPFIANSWMIINANGATVCEMWFRGMGTAGKNAEYLAHAANAYPKLVARAEQRASFLRHIVEQMPKSIRPLYEEALGAEAASDEALLRELGEAP